MSALFLSSYPLNGRDLRERFRPSANASKILAAWQPLVRLKELEERDQIATEVRDLLLCHETEDCRASIGPLEQFPGRASDSRCSHWCSTILSIGRGDRAGTAEGGEPDHDFVLMGAVGGGGGEHIVADICHYRRAGLRIAPFGGYGGDLCQRGRCQRDDGVGVGLDAIGSA